MTQNKQLVADPHGKWSCIYIYIFFLNKQDCNKGIFDSINHSRSSLSKPPACCILTSGWRLKGSSSFSVYLQRDAFLLRAPSTTQKICLISPISSVKYRGLISYSCCLSAPFSICWLSFLLHIAPLLLLEEITLFFICSIVSWLLKMLFLNS